MLFRWAVAATGFADLHRERRAVDHLHQAVPVVDEVTAFTDPVAVGFQVQDFRQLVFEIDIDFGRLAIVEALWKTLNGGIECRFHVLVGAGQAGVGLTEGTGGQRVRAEHRTRMSREPAVHADRPFLRRGWADFVKIEPGKIAWRFAGLALAKEQDIDDDVGAGLPPETAFRQANGADQIGGFCDVFPAFAIGFVHRTGAGDKGGEPAGFQEIDRPRDEVIVQPETERAIVPVGANRAVGEGRIADSQVVDFRKICPREIRIDNARPWLQQPRDAGGDRIELYAGEIAAITILHRHQSRKKACPDTGFQHPAAAPAEPLQAGPDRPDDVFGREVGILGAACKRGIVAFRDRRLQRTGEFLPALAETGLTRAAEHAVGELRAAETGEAYQPGLRITRSRPFLPLDLTGCENGRDIQTRPFPPGRGQTAIVVFEVEVGGRSLRSLRLWNGRRKGTRGGRGRRRRFRIVVIRGKTAECSDPDAEPRRKRAAGEDIEGEGIVAH